MFKARFIEPDLVGGRVDTHYRTFVNEGEEEWFQAGREVATLDGLKIHESARSYPGSLRLLMFDPKIDRFVGKLSTFSLRVQELSRACRKGLEEVAETAYTEYDRDVHGQFVNVVDEAFVDRRYRKMGAGVALYLAALAYGRVSATALVAGQCAHTETSREAKRVWASRAFRERAIVSKTGWVAVFRPESD